MRRRGLSRRELLRLGALALPGTTLKTGFPTLALDAASDVPRPAVATGVPIRYLNTGHEFGTHLFTHRVLRDLA